MMDLPNIAKILDGGVTGGADAQRSYRDIKPSNVLVTENDGKPVPKVIDFGIAKATEQKLTDKTIFTQFAAFIGTPAYTSTRLLAVAGKSGIG